MSKRTIMLVTGLCLHVLVTAAFAGSNTLHQGQYLFPGQTLAAPGCFFQTVMQDDGNLVTYGSSYAWWASGTQGKGGYAVLQDDNNFVIYNWADQPVWATGTNGRGADWLVQQDDGNLVLYGYSRPFWASGHYGESLGQSPCKISTVTTQVIVDADFFGGDYTYITLPSGVTRPSWCGYYCAKDNRCQAYTYTPPGYSGSNAVCWLKNGIPQAKPTSGLVSGFKIW